MRHSITTTVLITATAACFAPQLARAQTRSLTAPTDPRWFAWLGCWVSDGTVGGVQSPSTTCFVPVADSRGVDMLTIVRGTVVGRSRLVAGQGRAIDGLGCAGTETPTWSVSGRQVLIRSSYQCGGETPAGSTTILAFSPSGEFVRVEQVRSGSGAIELTDRLRSTQPPGAVPTTVVRAIERVERAVMTGRAVASAPITTDEIIEAVRRMDAGIVRAWVLATDQAWNLTGQQLSTLAAAGVPATVLQAVIDADARAIGAIVSDAIRTAVVYQSAPAAYGYQYAAPAPYQPMITINNYVPQAPQPMAPPYPYAPAGCGWTNPYSAYNGCGAGFSTFPFATPLIAGPFLVQGRTGRSFGTGHSFGTGRSFGRPGFPRGHGRVGRGR